MLTMNQIKQLDPAEVALVVNEMNPVMRACVAFAYACHIPTAVVLVADLHKEDGVLDMSIEAQDIPDGRLLIAERLYNKYSYITDEDEIMNFQMNIAVLLDGMGKYDECI